MLPFLREDFGNPASRSHVFGWRAEAAVEDARERVAAAIGAQPREILFTSGATEANNLALLGVAEASRRRHLITVATEHPSVLDPCEHLERRGFEISRLPVAGDGLLAPGAVEAALGEDTLLVSVMAANNEIGVVQPSAEIAALCRERGVLFHSDAAQAGGRLALDVETAGIDLLSLSGHKCYGPKGVGALFVRAGRPRIRIGARQYGGGHERGLRSGTLPVALIVGMARALELALEGRENEELRLRGLRDRLHERILAELDGVHLNGHREERLAGNLNLAFEGVDGERLLLSLPDLAVSSGSACASANPAPSHVLIALGLSEELARASLRFGLGRGTREADIDFAADRIIESVRAEREIRGGQR